MTKKISIDSSTTLSLANNNEWATGEIHLVDIKLLNSSGNSITELKHTQAVTIKLVYEVKNQVRYPMFGVGIHTTDFIYLATQQSINQLKIEKLDIGIYEFNFEIESFPFMPGVYSIRAGVAEGSASRTIFYAENLLHFQVTSENLADKTWNEGLVSLPGTWTFTAA